MPKAETMFWFKKLNLEAILEVFSLYGKYSGLHTNEIEINEKHCIITFHHELGKKWSIFLNHFISHFIKSSLGIMPKTDVTNGLVMVSFALDH